MNIFLKSFVFLGIYGVLHFGYELTGWSWLVPVFGTNESVFEHLKMVYWAYLFASLIEAAAAGSLRRRETPGFWPSRFLSVVLAPWVVVLIWYVLPGFVGKVESLAVELSWAFAVTYVVGLVAGMLEHDLERLPWKGRTRLLLTALLVLGGFFFVFFSFSTPWIDVFVDPATLE
ncbi:hypothetical protein Spith_1492 [Spirochaeta thermophila DSM 6578]|uniref:Uncharacterized protein n=1 Tax=Winmispira thermophila (strain ATCC 700085 / DSM 6578 / Z-1203) TaxID=869211 RepID=G0GAD6_WINT7|nr:DUF6512 family protein [Spirochaeta thermophila]AEJ61755.1 hypothetical protein Spith_1492 [Spirochaeta thermophila DSM 6578]